MHPLLRFSLDLFEPNRSSFLIDKSVEATKELVDFAHPQASREVLLGQTRVAYAFHRGQRRSIGFSVGPDGLAVRAPRWVTLRDVDAALRTKADWILRKLQQSRERQARLVDQAIVWQDGATLPFLGHTLTLRLDPEHRLGAGGAALFAWSESAGLTEVCGSTAAALVDWRENVGSTEVSSSKVAPAATPGLPLELWVSLPHNASAQQMRDCVQAWFMRQARALFQQRLDHFAPLLGVQWKKLALSNARTRWGSARHDGSIRLNWRLVHFSMSVVDYVVAHELSHLRVMDHSSRFWDTVRTVVPDYAVQRAQLKNETVPKWD